MRPMTNEGIPIDIDAFDRVHLNGDGKDIGAVLPGMQRAV